MNFLKAFLIILLPLWSLAKPLELVSQEFCSTFHWQKTNEPQTKKEVGASLIEFLQMSVLPESLLDVELRPFWQGSATEIKGGGKAKGVIILFSPFGAEKAETLGEELERFKRLQDEFFSYSKEMARLARARDFSHCQELVFARPQVYFRIKELSDVLSENEELSLYFQNEKAKKWILSGLARKEARRQNLINKHQKKFTWPVWQIVSGFNLNAVKAILENPDTQHVVVVGHADPLGRLLGQDGVFIPKNFFYHLGPNLRSIHIYSCYQKEALDFYQIPQLLGNQLSFFKTKQTSFTQLIKLPDSMQGKTLLSALGKFMSELDRALILEPSLSARGDLAKATSQAKSEVYRDRELFLNVSKVEVPFAVFVNGIFLQLLNPILNEEQIFVPQKFLEAENRIMIRPLDKAKKGQNEEGAGELLNEMQLTLMEKSPNGELLPQLRSFEVTGQKTFTERKLLLFKRIP